MDKIRTIEEAKTRLNERLNFYTARIEAWEKVERIHKKDGEDFAILSKSFTNCTFKTEYHSNYLYVYFRTDKEGYTHDFINLGGNVYTNEEPADTADRVQARIKDSIAKYEKYAETTKKGLETIEGIMQAITPTLDTLKEAIKEAGAVDCNYILGSYIKEYLNILNN